MVRAALVRALAAGIALAAGAAAHPQTAPPAGDALGAARDALDRGRPAQAVRALDTSPPSVERELLAVQALHAGFDHVAARDRALAASALPAATPQQRTTLLWWATNASLWLQDPGQSVELAERLQNSVDAAEFGQDAASWGAAAAAYTDQAAALSEAEGLRARVLARSRAVAVCGLGVLLLATAALALTGPRRRGR